MHTQVDIHFNLVKRTDLTSGLGRRGIYIIAMNSAYKYAYTFIQCHK